IANSFSTDPLHINISLPTLVPEKFQSVTASSKYLTVMNAIEFLVDAGFSSSISINFLFMPGMNDYELPELVKFTQKRVLRLKVICLTINEFNRAAISLYKRMKSEEPLIRKEIQLLGYTPKGSLQTFVKEDHV